ncbi:FtsK/SpoIIIE domain-containing protein [Arthrospira platensis]|uniref:Cell division protein FtsK n=1 Tax=Limnospira platensis NIES-46 TaxID=1236695 RepID=A0A5M3TCZ4_LIMPL|nr:FtsK/SpoIIIE domain-containing protein [Arthrospira platensis]AMW29886.1 ATP-binding protein [Arthrospira platensis YZ]KDR54271.1 ATP-binding protein [Arthrospira platensis str. Paraca]MBD2671907.1 S1 RNA-binding domain-containing protein [Arthrospira platensis FACHB-439]MBD2712951.1 S1 RNA-binding domain-containing protein [Arthrospira platensis FACHB-835]MDF2212084.1 FtsK/SpoIIIE domain-containing protein [Arthrospira platensis NCB002]MDT9184188.1 FtsK/SpoIIIE domain-containing protein [
MASFLENLNKLIQEKQEKNLKKADLQNQIIQEEKQFSQKIEANESELKQQTESLKKKVLSNLYIVNEDTKLAQERAIFEGNIFSQKLQQKQKEISQLVNQIDNPRLLSASWNDPRWTPSENSDSYKPQNGGLAPGVLRIGEFLLDQVQPPARVPALIPIRDFSNHLPNFKPGHIAIFSSDAESRQAALAGLESIALRVVSTFPVRKLKGIFIDPVSMGNTFPFKNLHQFISGQKTYTRSDDIREQLRGLTEHIEQVLQNYLGKNYQSIEDYNIAAQSVAEPYRYLFIADFPTGFDNNSWEDLKSIRLNGSRAGVYVILHIDETLEKPKNFDYRTFEDFCTVISPTHGLSVGAKPKQGNVYSGYVTSLTSGGAYVEFLPNTQGFVPTPKLVDRRIYRPEEAVSVGQKVVVKVHSINSRDEIELTCLDINPTEETAARQKNFRSSQNTNQSLFELKLPNDLVFKVALDEPPPNEQFNQILQLITEEAKKISVETLPFSKLYPQQAWSEDSRKEIRAPIGLMGAMDKLEFWLGENEDKQLVSHGLLAGKTGSGKSYTLHAIIVSLALRYSPDELELYLLDFKEGVEFQMYVDPEKGETSQNAEELNEEKALPHAKVVSIESDREFGLSVLEYVNKQIEERSIKFKSAGNLNKLQDYRDKTGETMPRILVVIDEFQYMFQENDNITRSLNQVMDNITRQGRAFGIHLLIASQSPNVPNMSRGIYSQIDLRMAQQMDKSTASSVLAEGNTDAVDLLDKPGKVIYNKDYGKKNQNEIGQVADISAQERSNALVNIQEIVNQNHYQRSEPLILFNGSRPTKLSHNRQLVKLSDMTEWLSLKELNKQVIKEPDWVVQETPGIAWLGEPMRIGDHTKAIFRRRPRNNMMIVGSSEEIVLGIIGGILMSLIHCYQPQKARFMIADLSIPDEDNDWTEMTINFRNAFNSYFPTQIAKRFADPDCQVIKAETLLNETYEEFERRLKQREENPDQNPDDLGDSLFFVYAVGGLNRSQNLRPVMGHRSEEPSEDAERLLKLISQGSELGIHTIFWLEDMKTFLKLTGDNRSWLTHFDLRVALNMPGDDSRLLLGEVHAEKLPRLRAYFRDDSATAGLEKFKPYAVPTKEEIGEYCHNFEQRLT